MDFLVILCSVPSLSFVSPFKRLPKLSDTLINMSDDAEEGKGQRNYGNKHSGEHELKDCVRCN